MKNIKVLPLLLVVCLWLPGCGKGESIQDKQQALKQEGMELQTAGDYSGALEKYNEALSLSDMKVGAAELDLAYYKASAQYRSGDVDGAIATYSAILDLKESGEGYLGRAVLYLSAQDVDKAEADLNQALRENNSSLMKGIVYDVAGNTAKAKEYLEKAKKEGEPEAVFFLADIYEEAGDHNYAMILLEEYISGSNAGVEGYLNVGRNYFDNGAYEDALAVFQAGIEQGESGMLKELLQEEIACYEKMGDFASAKEKAASYLESYPEDDVIQKEYEFLRSR